MEIFDARTRNCGENSTEETSNQLKSRTEYDNISKVFTHCDIRDTTKVTRISVDSEIINTNSVSKDADNRNTEAFTNNFRHSFYLESLNKLSVSEDAGDTKASKNNSIALVYSQSINKMTVFEDADNSDTRVHKCDSRDSFNSDDLNKMTVSEDADRDDTTASTNDSTTSFELKSFNKMTVSDDADSGCSRASTNDSRASVDLESLNKVTVSVDEDISDIKVSTDDSTISVDWEGLSNMTVSEDADNSDTRDYLNDCKSSVDSEGLNENLVSEDDNSSYSRSSSNFYRTPVDSVELNTNSVSEADDSSETVVSTADSKNSDNSQILNKKPASERNGAVIPNKNIIFSLFRSLDFDSIKKIAAVIPKKSSTLLESVESAIFLSGLENEIKYVLVHENAFVICCQLHIGGTLVATGRETTEEKAKEAALKYGVEILTNLPNLPCKTLEDVKQELENWKRDRWNSSLVWSEISSSDLESKSRILRSQLSEMEKNPKYADLHLILRIADTLFEEKYAKNRNIPAIRKIEAAAAKLKCASQLHFFHFGEDPYTPLHHRAFHCDFVIKNVFICQSKACSKNKAKVDAADQGLHFLKQIIENCEFERQQNVQTQLQSLETNPNCQLIDGSLPNCRINNRLLINSKIQQLVIFDFSETNYQYNTRRILFVTAIKCKKDLKYETVEIPKRKWSHQRHRKEKKLETYEAKNSAKMIRCTITLNKEEIGKADGFTEKEAKSNAAEKALQFLQKNVYTIKVKKKREDSLMISRSHVISVENPSSIFYESNEDYKFLKMEVCPTCGGTGKISDKTRSIVENVKKFDQGAVVSNKAQKKTFERKIKALLKYYSQSNIAKDLIFSTEFSKSERMQICRLAMSYNLSRVFLGRGQLQEKQLSLRRKLSAMQLLDYLVEAGGSTNKYELVDRSVLDQKSVSR